MEKFVMSFRSFFGQQCRHRDPRQRGHQTGSGGGSVGRAVASDTRNPRFEPQHCKNFISQLYIYKEKTKINEKEAGNGPS